MITVKDLNLLAPYMARGKVLNMEVKEFGKTRNRGVVREVLLEFEDGTKLTGDLNNPNFKMTKLQGLTTIASYFARGRYGNNQWRGNFSGLLVKDLIEFYNPKFVIDPMVGGGTSHQVFSEMGVNNLCLDLNPKWGEFDALNMELPCSSDFIIWHPPYMAFEGSSMPRYSGVEWGNQKHSSDGSHITDPVEFTKWFNKIQANFYASLRKGGRMAIVMGDSRYRGDFYSMLKNMDVYGTLEQVIIKHQHNCISDSVKYSGAKFIPIQHEYLVIIRKDDNYIFPCHIVKSVSIDIRKSEKITWKTLIQAILENMGGKASVGELFEALSKHQKAKNNNNVREKIRQVLGKYSQEFERVADGVFKLRDLSSRVSSNNLVVQAL